MTALSQIVGALGDRRVRTTAPTEWAWAFGRVAIVVSSALATLVLLNGTELYPVILPLLGLIFLYNLALMFFLYRGRVISVFWMGFVLDNAVLFAAWLAVVSLEAGNVSNTDLMLGSMPIIIAGVARLGSGIGVAYTLVLLGWITWMTLAFYDPTSYDVQQLPLRLIFIGIVAGIAIQVVARLRYSQRQAEVIGQAAQERGDRLQSMRHAIERERLTLEAIQASMTEGLVVLDSAKHVMYLNPTAEMLLGATSNSWVGERLDFVWPEAGLEESDSVAVSPRDAVLRAVEQSANEPQTVEITLADPRERIVAITAFPIPLDTEERMTGLLLRDITQERALLRRRDEFISVASHELRTPMTTLLGFSELLLTRDVSDDIRRDWLERINKESYRLTSIVEDLLNVSQIQSGQMKVNLEKFSPMEMVTGVVEEVRGLTEKHSYVIEIPPDLPQVVADREKLGQIVKSLVDNAARYSPQGGQITISARAEESARRVVFSVADQGIGIAEEDQRELFSTFHRVHHPQTVGIRGTGLGLYIVKMLLEAMNGEIWLESDLGKGSTFFFSLPTEFPPEA